MGWILKDDGVISGSDLPAANNTNTQQASTSSSSVIIPTREKFAQFYNGIFPTTTRFITDVNAEPEPEQAATADDAPASSSFPSSSNNNNYYYNYTSDTTISPIINAPNTRVAPSQASRGSKLPKHGTTSYNPYITFKPHQTDASPTRWPKYGYKYPQSESADGGSGSGKDKDSNAMSLDTDTPEHEYSYDYDYVRIDDEEANVDRSRVSTADAQQWEKKVEMWKKKIGSYLGNRRDLSEEDLKDTTKHRIYHLTSFPPGYALFDKPRHGGSGGSSGAAAAANNNNNSANNNNRSKGRRVDQHLWGSLNAPSFRSPAEFFEHAEWLLNDMRDPCGCQYCDRNYKGRGSRKVINYTK